MVSLLCCFGLYGLHKMDESVWKDELLTRKKKNKGSKDSNILLDVYSNSLTYSIKPHLLKPPSSPSASIRWGCPFISAFGETFKIKTGQNKILLSVIGNLGLDELLHIPLYLHLGGFSESCGDAAREVRSGESSESSLSSWMRMWILYMEYD